MALPISFRWDEQFIARIDKARGDVPRSAFVRRAVEQALGEQATSVENPAREGVPGASGVAGPAPAEQPELEKRLRAAVKHYEPDLRELAEDQPPAEQPSATEAVLPRVAHYRQLAARSSVQAKRGTGPRPKGGK